MYALPCVFLAERRSYRLTGICLYFEGILYDNLPPGHSERCNCSPPEHFVNYSHGVRHIQTVFPNWQSVPSNHSVDFVLNSFLYGVRLVGTVEQMPHNAASQGVRSGTEEAQNVTWNVFFYSEKTKLIPALLDL